MTSTTAVSLRRTDLPRLSVSVKAAATVLAIVAAVALPQLFHVIGAVSGRGTALGVAFLPMHLPIIFVGLIAGPAVGAIAWRSCSTGELPAFRHADAGCSAVHDD